MASKLYVCVYVFVFFMIVGVCICTCEYSSILYLVLEILDNTKVYALENGIEIILWIGEMVSKLYVCVYVFVFMCLCFL